MASTILLSSYVRKPEFEDFLNAFYDGVCESDLVKHYFFSRKSGHSAGHEEIQQLPHPKTSLDYRRPAASTASPDIQLPDSQISEISQIMSRVLREKKFTLNIPSAHA